MWYQYGQIVTVLAIGVLAVQGQTPDLRSALDDAFAGMSSSQLEDFLGDLSYMDYPGGYEKRPDYDYEPDTSDTVQNVDQASVHIPQAPKAPANPTSMLPAYCDPPNPCPIGYTSADGCIEDFENTSEFSRRYQASQKCICDTEHMFDCPEENAHRGPEDIAAVNILANIDGLVSTDADNNPYMDGQKLPVAAKKGHF